MDATESDDGEEGMEEYRHLLKDPKSLLQKAQDVLRKKFGILDVQSLC